MPVGIITGSGTYELAQFDAAQPVNLPTPYGEASLTPGRLAGVEILHVSRHGRGHVRLSNHVNHRAYIWALKELGATSVIGCTACGALDSELTLGSLVVFDDLHFLSNRLPDGALCTFFDEPGDPARGHWILHGGPYSERARAALIAAAAETRHDARPTGTYGHVDGPRFNTPAEIAQLRGCGVTAVSQTGGPETVLCGELELPFALIGFVTDYANEVRPGLTTPVDELIALMGQSSAVFSEVLVGAVGTLAQSPSPPDAAGTVYRFGAP